MKDSYQVQASAGSSTLTAPYERNETTEPPSAAVEITDNRPALFGLLIIRTLRLGVHAGTAYEGPSGTFRRAPDYDSSVESCVGIINISGVPF